MTTKRIPRKEIVIRFKYGAQIDELCWEYRQFFKRGEYPLSAIEDIIRQYMKKQRP